MSAYGQPPAQPAQTGGGSGLGLPAMIAYGAGALGVLSFIWGFLDFYSAGSAGVSGYASGGAGIVALPVLAGLIAAAEAYAAKPVSLLTVAASVAGLLVVFGSLVDTQQDADASVGLILLLITSLIQVGGLVYIWLIAEGKISAPAPKPQAPQGFGGPQGGQPGYPPQAPQGGYQPQGQPGYQPQGGQPGYPPQGGQPGYQQPGGYQPQGQQSPPPPPPGQYGPPTGQ